MPEIPPGWQYPREEDLANTVLDQLSQHFFIQREVWGQHCTGKRLRLDAALRPRDPQPWFDANPAFGVEFKNALVYSFDTRNFTAWAAQAVDYTHVNWAGYERLMIFTCPPVSMGLKTYGNDAARLMVRVLGQLGVGELGKESTGWTLWLNGDRLWQQGRGVRRRQSLIPKSRSR